MKKQLTCDWCGSPINRYPSQIKARNFCSRSCLGHFANKKENPEGYQFRDFSKNSARFTKMNRALNPNRMTPKTRFKIRIARLNTGKNATYEKFMGRHTHRVVAELMLGRPLKQGEVVHHMDGDKRNNLPENLKVFPSQTEHVKWHNNHKVGGDAQ